jgi:hypothetical protein
MSDSLETLIAEAAVNRLIARYATMTDWMDWAGMLELFSADADIDFGGMFRGTPVEFMPFVSKLEGGYDRRMHLFGLPRIDVTGTTARAECASITYVRTKGIEQHDDANFCGRYVFTAAKADGVWKLTRLTFYLNAATGSQVPAGDEGPINLADGFAPGHPEMA